MNGNINIATGLKPTLLSTPMAEKDKINLLDDRNVLGDKFKQLMLNQSIRNTSLGATQVEPSIDRSSTQARPWTKITFSDYSKVPKRKQKHRARLPPIQPSNKNLYPIYTPPGTPQRSIRRTDRSFRTMPPYDLPQISQRHLGIAKPNLEFSSNTQARAPSFLNDLLRFSEPLPDAVTVPWPFICQADSNNDAPEFIDAVEENNEPDYLDIKDHCNRYYPHILKMFAPASHHMERCSNTSCQSDNKIPCYTCTCCFNRQWFCKRCIVESHQNNPFHRIKKWDAENFTSISVSLKSLGLIMRLNQLEGRLCTCSQAESGLHDLEVLHSNGIHEIKYSICDCGTSRNSQPTSAEQLLTNGLYPATNKAPRRAFTFEVLSEYDFLNLFAFINIKRFLDTKSYITPKELQCSEQVSETIV